MRHRWKRQKERVDHADDWLMTYADMITLLLCFFAVMLSVAIPQKLPKAETPPVEKVGTPAPKPPDIFEGNLPFHDITQDEFEAQAQSQTAQQTIAEQKPAEPPSVITPVAEPIAELPQPAPAEAAPPASLPEIVDRLMKTQGNADIEQKGDRITTLQMSSAAFFGSGSATLSASGKGILQEVAGNLKSEKFRDYQITVEGHTDDQPIKTLQFPSNWELSTARAAAVVHFFLEQGVSAKKLRAAGYADTFPLAPNRDASGNAIPANQAQNRRVVIQLEKIEKKE